MKHTPTPRTNAFIARCEKDELSIFEALTAIQEHARDVERDHDTLVARVAELETALRDLLKAEEDYGECNNVAVNQAWLAATRILAKVKP